MSPLLGQHEGAGRYFRAGEVGSFVGEAGSGETLVCLHGVPVLCFVYRKLLGELASRGVRVIAFDLLGIGLVDRPDGFDYCRCR